MQIVVDFVLSDWMYVWLAVVLVTAIIEIITVGLTSIWVSGTTNCGVLYCDIYLIVFYKTVGEKISGKSQGSNKLRRMHWERSTRFRRS